MVRKYSEKTFQTKPQNKGFQPVNKKISPLWKSRVNFYCRKKKSLNSLTDYFIHVLFGLKIIILPMVFNYWPGAYLFMYKGWFYPYLGSVNYVFSILFFFITALNDPGILSKDKNSENHVNLSILKEKICNISDNSQILIKKTNKRIINKKGIIYSF